MTISLWETSGHQKARAKVKPTYRSSSKSSLNSASIALTIPGDAQVGDCAIFGVTTINGATNTTVPSGVLLLGSSDGDGGSLKLWVYSKFVTAGEAGTTKTFVYSSSDRVSGAVALYPDVGGLSVALNFYKTASVEPLNSRPPRLPSVWAGPDDRIVGIAGGYGLLSLNAAHAGVATPPTGFTLRQASSGQSNALTLPRGCSIFDAPGHGLAMEEFEFVSECHSVNAVLVLSPVNPRWAQMERVPPTLQAKPVYIYGSSSSALVEGPATFGYNTRTPWGMRLVSALGNLTDSKNFSVPGARAADTCCLAYGTATYATGAVNGDPNAVSQAGTWSAIANKDSFVVCDLAGNDVISMGSGATARAGVANSADSFFRLARSLAVYHWNLPNITATGTWSTSSSTGLIGGSARLTTVPGAKYDIAVSGITDLDIVLIGGDNTALGSVGSTYAIKVDGVTVATGTTHDQMASTGFGNNYGFVQIVVPVTGMTTAAHTITIEHTGSNGHLLMFNGCLEPDPTPPWIVACVLGEMPAATYSSLGFTKVAQDDYREIIRTVTQRFADGRVILYDPSIGGLWNPATHYAPDGVHQNEIGHAHMSHEIIRMLWERCP